MLFPCHPFLSDLLGRFSPVQVCGCAADFSFPLSHEIFLCAFGWMFFCDLRMLFDVTDNIYRVSAPIVFWFFSLSRWHNSRENRLPTLENLNGLKIDVEAFVLLTQSLRSISLIYLIGFPPRSLFFFYFFSSSGAVPTGHHPTAWPQCTHARNLHFSIHKAKPKQQRW